MVDALKVEKANLQRRLIKIKATMEEDPLGELFELHKKFAELDSSKPCYLEELTKLAEKEKKLKPAIERRKKFDFSKAIDIEVNVSMEIETIDHLIFINNFR
jgi:predicted nuclease with TOPRIM domain